MKRASEMTPAEAQKCLEQIQNDVRQRQADYRKRAEAEGRAKVNTYLSPEASTVLESCRANGMTIPDALSAAMVFYGQHGMGVPKRQAPTPRPAARPTPASLPAPAAPPADGLMIPYGPSTVEYIKELFDRGVSLSKISGRLNAEGFETKSGTGIWFHKTVGGILKKEGLWPKKEESI